MLLKPPLPRHAERARPRLANWSGSCGVRTATQGQRCSRPLRGRRTSEPPQPSSTNGSEPSSSGGARSGQCPSSLGTAFGVHTPNARKAKRLLWSAPVTTPNSVAHGVLRAWCNARCADGTSPKARSRKSRHTLAGSLRARVAQASELRSTGPSGIATSSRTSSGSWSRVTGEAGGGEGGLVRSQAIRLRSAFGAHGGARAAPRAHGPTTRDEPGGAQGSCTGPKDQIPVRCVCPRDPNSSQTEEPPTPPTRAALVSQRRDGSQCRPDQAPEASHPSIYAREN